MAPKPTSAPDTTSDPNPDPAAPQNTVQKPLFAPPPTEDTLLRTVFFGPDGFRSGWSVALFALLYYVFSFPVTLLLPNPPGGQTSLSPWNGLHDEICQMLPMLLAWLIVARIERRRLSVYFLAGKRTISRFLLGSAGGFVALSVLVALLFFGHWLQIAPASLPVAAAIEDALLWAIVFLMVGVFEEGAFRCYLLYTLARSFGHSPRGFWIAALLSSAIFGVIHFGNTGESQIGILSAAAIGFVFCVSVRLTGTVWWAFGFHFAWDWAETYFYGTSDSGLIPRGSLYLSTPVGSPLWSGGVTGPEGSPLVIPVVLATLLLVIAVYGPGQRSSSTAIPGEPGQTPGQIPGIGPG